MGLKKILFGQPKSPAQKKEEWRRKQEEWEAEQRGYRKAKLSALEARGRVRGREAAKPLTRRIGEGFGKFQSGLGKVEKGLGRIEKSGFLDYDFGLGLEPTRKRKHKKKRR